MKPIPKKSRIRVNRNSKAWAELDNTVRLRDMNSCVCCGCYVPTNVPLHHEPPKKMGGGDGEDVPDKMCVLCVRCHYERHHGKDSLKVKVKCVGYLRGKNETNTNK